MPPTWNNGSLEKWNNGQKRLTTVFELQAQYSNIPVFHLSIIPAAQPQGSR
jgi:hypothetical protein